MPPIIHRRAHDRRHATLLLPWIQRESLEFETHRRSRVRPRIPVFYVRSVATPVCRAAVGGPPGEQHIDEPSIAFVTRILVNRARSCRHRDRCRPGRGPPGWVGDGEFIGQRLSVAPCKALNQ